MSEKEDNFFTTLDNTTPYFKAAFEGFAGSGKTFTSAQLLIWLHKRIESKKPIAYVDTEKAGRHLRAYFKKAGIEVLYKPTRSLRDLTEVMKRGREGAFDILLIDSISHIWEDLLASYMKMKNRSKMEFQDWGVVKPKWKAEFADPFVKDPYHAIMCGRAGYEYEDEKDEDGKRQIFKSGIKMKAETETAYEPDMLVMMERCEDIVGKEKHVWREATIIKDRSTLLDGKTFKNPTPADFAPAIEFDLEDAVERDDPPAAENQFAAENNNKEFFKARTVALEILEAELMRNNLTGTGAEVKKTRVELLEQAFGTPSRTIIEGMTPEKLNEGIEKLRQLIAARAAA